MGSVNTKRAKEQKKIGRPPLNGKVAVLHWNMRVTEDFVAGIDEWRRKQPDLPNRTEAIRRLVELGKGAS